MAGENPLKLDDLASGRGRRSAVSVGGFEDRGAGPDRRVGKVRLMTKFLLAMHVIAAIIAVGPVAVAASMFPAAVRKAIAHSAGAAGAAGAAVAAVAQSAVARGAVTVGSGDGAGGGSSSAGDGGVDGDRAESLAAVKVLHRICRVYAVIALAVPVLGFAVAGQLHVLGSPWLVASITLTAVAAAVLGLLVLPRQNALLRELAWGGQAAIDRAATARLAMLTGLFNLLWATVTVLMILRPGSTTGV
jgi:hypothetical protein